MKSLLRKILTKLDLLFAVICLLPVYIMRLVRRVGVQHFPLMKRLFSSIGVFPIRDHYYEPIFNYKNIDALYENSRELTGIDLNEEGQLHHLKRLKFSEDFKAARAKASDTSFSFESNDSFLSGDAEYWYQTVRFFKPKRIVEIGSGNSTRIACEAIEHSKNNDPKYTCEHTCIEPYEMPWLEQTSAKIVRKTLEEADRELFWQLEKGDILFIDSSHIIRPGGDVLIEYLEILPKLKSGVIVHIHDIFTPRHYLREWLEERVFFWNEQYLLEAFLSHNKDWKVLGALNFLKHNHFDALREVCPFLTADREPGSFYLVRN